MKNGDTVRGSPPATTKYSSAIELNNLLDNDLSRRPRGSNRKYPRAIALLCVIVSLVNIALVPVVIFYITRSRRSWSMGQYRSAYHYVNIAAGVASTGVVLTGATLFALVLTGTFAWNAKIVWLPKTEDHFNSTIVGKTLKVNDFTRTTLSCNNTQLVNSMVVITCNTTDSSFEENTLEGGTLDDLDHIQNVQTRYLNATHFEMKNKETNETKIFILSDEFITDWTYDYDDEPI